MPTKRSVYSVCTSYLSRITGIGFKRSIPPAYNNSQGYEENFARFFDWATSLRRPMSQIPSIAEDLGFGVRRHPIGFVAVYLSERDGGVCTPSVTGIARVNIYPPGDAMKEDIHCHGFDFRSGVAAGILLNTVHHPDFSGAVPDGEGYIGYETRVDALGNNMVTQATDAVIAVPRSELHELSPGDEYSMRAGVDFHSVAAGDQGALTVFCKTPSDGISLVLKPAADVPPPDLY